ncbi:LuxR C-terminal-related transcriptional regulator, partial [bacterium]|nr:LuxR C-terminal-related transcriptional regulator [bacterium]
YFEWNQVSKANQLLENALDSLRLTTENGIIINALIQQILAKFALRHDKSELKSLITQLELMGRFHDKAASLAEALQMKLSFAAGDYSLDVDAFEDSLERDSGYFDRELHYYQEYEWQLTGRLIKSRLFIKHCRQANEKPDQKSLSGLIQFLTTQLAGAEKWAMTRLVIEVSIVLSLLHELNENCKEADSHLKRALDLAAPEGAIRPFLEQGQDLFHLLNKVRSHGRYLDFIDKIKSFATPEEEKSSLKLEIHPILSALPAEQLSSRELEVLKLIAAGHTNREIATRLYISSNTVKFHVTRLYTKLDVHKRTQAVSKAKSLGIL